MTKSCTCHQFVGSRGEYKGSCNITESGLYIPTQEKRTEAAHLRMINNSKALRIECRAFCRTQLCPLIGCRHGQYYCLVLRSRKRVQHKSRLVGEGSIISPEDFCNQGQIRSASLVSFLLIKVSTTQYYFLALASYCGGSIHVI